MIFTSVKKRIIENSSEKDYNRIQKDFEKYMNNFDFDNAANYLIKNITNISEKESLVSHIKSYYTHC